jgi:thiosulfate/3-mercaptopyruvate sulfurtransferase
LEEWEKAYLKNTDFLESEHGKVGCVICHGGDSSAEDKDTAHLGVLADPSEESCAICHSTVALPSDTSLHATLSGYIHDLEARGGDLSEGTALDEALGNHCEVCHTTCGQCHISRPEELGGGLLSSHVIKETPSMQYNCTACHGSRVGNEYLGNNEGIAADVHWTQGTMTCTKCHGEELHGSGQSVDDMYENIDVVRCEDCHEDVLSDDIEQHQQHVGDLQCQVCHSVTYSNCYSCHVGLDQNGLAYRTSDPTVMEFKIGLNPIVSEDRPYTYVVLRHVPVTPDTFDYYGDNLLPDFNASPTWKYATPHNIQLHTPQNESCNSCHGNEDLFLTEDDVSAEEREANRGVIVINIPESQ